MTKPMIRIHNVETNKVIDREMTDKEFSQWQEDQVGELARLEAEETKAAQKAALLDRLGITEDEAKLLLA
jgi:hypothetical protein